MKEKCTKFESLYLFRSEEELEEHLKECPDCRAEKEKMDKVSDLLAEVRPYYAQKRKWSYANFKIACVLCLGLFAGMTIGYFSNYGYSVINTDNNTAVEQQETTNEYGLPVDSYGLITGF